MYHGSTTAQEPALIQPDPPFHLPSLHSSFIMDETTHRHNSRHSNHFVLLPQCSSPSDFNVLRIASQLPVGPKAGARSPRPTAQVKAHRTGRLTLFSSRLKSPIKPNPRPPQPLGPASRSTDQPSPNQCPLLTKPVPQPRAVQRNRLFSPSLSIS